MNMMDIQGFLHISEIAPGWIRSINKFVKDGEKKVLLVKKVESRKRGYRSIIKTSFKRSEKTKAKRS